MRAMYFLGEDISKMEAYFYNAIDDLEHTETSKVGYIYALDNFLRNIIRNG